MQRSGGEYYIALHGSEVSVGVRKVRGHQPAIESAELELNCQRDIFRLVGATLWYRKFRRFFLFKRKRAVPIVSFKCFHLFQLRVGF